MKRKDWVTSVTAGIILGALIVISQTIGQFPTAQNAHAASDAEKVLSKALQSYKNWSTLQGEARLVQYDTEGTPHVDLVSVEVAQPLKANISFKASDDKAKTNKKWVSDGEKIYQVDDENLSYTESIVPGFATNLDFIPKGLADVKKDEVYHHPFEMLISNPIMEYVYPVWFAQAGEESSYELLGEESIAGRATWKVQLQTTTDRATAWIDQKTGVILKYSQETRSEMVVEMEFNWIEFDKHIDAQKFSLPSQEKYHKVENP